MTTTRQLRSLVTASDDGGEVRLNIEQAEASGAEDEPVVTAPISPKVMPALKARLGKSMPVGNEGAGTVVAAGDDPQAQALVGKKVAFLGDGTYAEHALTAVQMALP